MRLTLNFLLLLFLMCILVFGEVPVSVEINSNGNAKPTPFKKTNFKPEDLAMGVKIRNPKPRMVEYYWWSGTEKFYQGKIRENGVTATNSYVGHQFIVTELKQPNKEIFRFTVNENQNMYVIPPDDPQDATYLKLLEEQKFMQAYQQKTGRPWLAHYPRNPPVLHMWPADYVGQKHKIISNQTFWNCIPENQEDKLKCQTPGTLELEIEVVSTAPKIYSIKNTINDFEADFIINMSSTRIQRSLAGDLGGLVSQTRTSHNTWLGRQEHDILDTLYRRAADILNIPESLLVSSANVEDLQVVHYGVGQEYTAHHDFGADGRPQSRYITLLYYLNNQLSKDAGGETYFPKANNGEGFGIHPGKGNSVLFYSLLEDGNADDLSLHAATPVKKGEKWICNFWVWDPYR